MSAAEKARFFHLVIPSCTRQRRAGPQEIFCRGEIDRLLQIFSEKGREFIEWDEFHPVIKVNVTGAWNDDQFFGLTGQLVSLFAELPGMGNLTRDEVHGTKRIHLAADFVARTGPLLCAIACHRRESTHLQRLRAVLWNHAVYVP
jgi:hypothetical protein